MAVPILAQGPLTPTGAPAPQRRTLTQIEPRIDLATVAGDPTAVAILSQRGSYDLSASLTVTGSRVGIAIAASEVTIDLNGFSIVGSATSPAGIEFRGNQRGCRIFNGSVRPAGRPGRCR